MRQRRDMPDAECDADLEPALLTLRRAIMRGLLRRAWQEERLAIVLARLLGSSNNLGATYPTLDDAWKEVCDRRLNTERRTLRPSDLPRQISIARLILHQLRLASGTAARGDRSRGAAVPDLADCP
jgi:hypothetical protein